MQCTYTGELANCTAFGTRKPSDPECGTFDKTLLQNVNVTKDKKKKKMLCRQFQISRGLRNMLAKCACVSLDWVLLGMGVWGTALQRTFMKIEV